MKVFLINWQEDGLWSYKQAGDYEVVLEPS